MSDFAQRRVTMVDTQVRPADVTKFPIIDAMLTVPRETFVPDGRRELAYMDENIDLGAGRVILAPRTLAKFLEEIDPAPDELVLLIGGGLGYSAAVIARLAEAVVALEEDDSHAEDAQAALSAEGVDNVAVVSGTLVEGASRHGPYDVILIEGAVERVPDEIVGQLNEGGRIGCIFSEGRLGVARIGYKIDGQMTWRPVFNAGAPVLPGFGVQRAFSL